MLLRLDPFCERVEAWMVLKNRLLVLWLSSWKSRRLAPWDWLYSFQLDVLNKLYSLSSSDSGGAGLAGRAACLNRFFSLRSAQASPNLAFTCSHTFYMCNILRADAGQYFGAWRLGRYADVTDGCVVMGHTAGFNIC